MGIEDWKARLDALLNEQETGGKKRGPETDPTLLGLKAALEKQRDAILETEHTLKVERDQLETAERRGRMAAEIRDQETVDIAARFAARHRQRVELWERKLAVQRDEFTLIEVDYRELSERQAQAGPEAQTSELGDVGEDPMEIELLQLRKKRQAAEAAAEAQLEMLKKKMGKDS